jgi:tRNA(fMet)-specific endonuclease VapC
MVLLDTDTLTHLHANHPRVVKNFHACNDPMIGITVVTRIEIV